MATLQNQNADTIKQLKIAIEGREAHIDFDAALNDFPFEHAAVKPAGAPHSAWQLLEHMRIAQRDILEFSRDARHASPKWPDEYWPADVAPPSHEAWQSSLEAFRRDRREFEQLLEENAATLDRPLPHSSGQTLLREALLIALHHSYHLGQIVFLKRQMGATKAR